MSKAWIVEDGLWDLIEPLLPPWPDKAPGPRPVPATQAGPDAASPRCWPTRPTAAQRSARLAVNAAPNRSSRSPRPTASKAWASPQVAPDHRRGARNLVRYTTLRQRDVRELQNDLMDLGATSLASPEANGRAKVQAARTVLAALRGDPGPWDLRAIDDDLDAGDDILDAHACALFGPPEPAHPHHGDAAQRGGRRPGTGGRPRRRRHGRRPDQLRTRRPGAWTRMIGHVHAASAAAGRRVLVSMDLAGPKLRTGPIADGPVAGRARVARDAGGHLIAPATLWLVSAREPTPPAPEVWVAGPR